VLNEQIRPAYTPSEVTCLLLASGLGTRVKFTDEHPKLLLDIAGRPFVFQILDQLARAGLRHVVVCSDSSNALVQAAVGKAYLALAIDYSTEPQPLGSAGAARLALPLARSMVVLVAGGTSFCEVDLLAVWRRWAADRSRALMVVAHVQNAARYSRVAMDRGGHVTEYRFKLGEHGPDWIDAGLYLAPRAWLQAIPSDRPVSFERTIIPAWVERGVRTYRAPGAYIDVSTPDAYASARRFFSSR
jgi:NDP-sugar pyrophosphorylase family protein